MQRVLLKSIFSCVGIIAGGCAIGVPASMNSRHADVLDRGGGISMVTMNNCSSPATPSVSEEIKFGESSDKVICGFTGADSSNIGGLENEKYSELFTQMGSQKDSNWNSANVGQWKANCLSPSPKGVVSTSGGEEILGTCDGTNNHTPNGVLVKDKNTNELKIEVCESNCGKDTFPQNSISTLSNRDESKWKKVEFYILK